MDLYKIYAILARIGAIFVYKTCDICLTVGTFTI